MTDGLEFDPGFGPNILAFQGSIEYIYTDINRFKNFSQKKMKFRQYYKKMLEVFYNNLGFYTGCLMWASYIKTQEVQDILNNPCLGKDYDEKQDTFDIDYVIKFVKLFPKDVKYFLGENFEFDESIMKLLEEYREFLIINKGFVESKTNNDIKIPENLIVDNAESYGDKIEEVIQSKDLSKLNSFISEIIKSA